MHYSGLPDAANAGDLFGFAFRRVDHDGKLVGPPLPRHTLRYVRLKAFYRYKIRSELIGLNGTEHLHVLEFHKVAPLEHIPEGVTHAKTPKTLKAVYVDHPIRRYCQRGVGQSLTEKWDRKERGINWAQGKYTQRRPILNEAASYMI